MTPKRMRNIILVYLRTESYIHIEAKAARGLRGDLSFKRRLSSLQTELYGKPGLLLTVRNHQLASHTPS